MNVSGIKSKVITNKIERLLKNRNKQDSLKVASVINTVGIIVDQGSVFNFESLKKLQREIASGSKNFYILTCKTIVESFNEFRGVSFYEKDFSWNGTLKSKEVSDFLNVDYDMLIDYTKANTIFKKYFVSKSSAKFKVGYANVDDRLYDFMISIENEGVNQFNEELVKYLRILKKIQFEKLK